MDVVARWVVHNVTTVHSYCMYVFDNPSKLPHVIENYDFHKFVNGNGKTTV